ncbi:MAG: UDP-N-acetylmuramoyl-L-alanyl-D-glutamate--2,6-diaminopimelate ligase [Patescibacteria group bacterium]
MKNLIRSFLPQWLINNFWHLPKGILANIYYGFPARGLKVIGVTGTDGKTTTVNMIYQILKSAGKKVSMVSTINAFVGGKSYDTGFHVTSPDPFMVQRFAKEALDKGDEYMVLEVTSHALDQFRFFGIKCEVGVITNVTHEHLDYHKTFENYLNTKLKLIKNTKFSIINENLKPQLIGRSFNKLITFGLDKGDFNQKEIKLKLKIFGQYNIENALASFAVAFILDIPKEVARSVLENFNNLPGRMEEMENDRGIKIFIDFAHTPNGLESALRFLHSPAGGGRIISLIGCEGDRDVGKRAMMGEIAQRLSDVVIVTAVDPRGQMDSINKKIKEGAKKAGAKINVNFFVIEDRQKAIDFAINKIARKRDIVGIFGKGHEISMNMDGKKEIPWSDKKAVKDALNGF